MLLYTWLKQGEKFVNVDSSSVRYVWMFFLFYHSPLHLLHSTCSARFEGSPPPHHSLYLSPFPSRSHSLKRRISSAVRNLQILFQLHPGKRSFSPIRAGKTASATLKTRPIAELRAGRANFYHLDVS